MHKDSDQPTTSASDHRAVWRDMRWLLPLLAGLTAVITWPLVTQINTHLAGVGLDIWSHQWTFHAIRDALLQGQNPFYTDRIFYPTGVSLANHNIAWLQILLWIPLQAIMPAITAYNLLFMLLIILSGAAMYAFALDILKQRGAALLSAIIFAFWPYILSQNEHPNLMIVAWLPLALLFMKRAFSHRRRRDVVLTAVFLALLGWVRWQMLVMAAFPVAFYTLAQILQPPRAEFWSRIRLLVGIGFITAVLLLPIAVPVFSYHVARPFPEDLFLEEQDQKQTDLLAYITPSALHPLWEDELAPIYGRFYNNFDVQNQQRTPYLGYTVLFLALFGALFRRRRMALWTGMALLILVLALGPTLRINGQLFPTIPMPYALIENISLIRLLRISDRFNVILALPMALLAGSGLLVLRQRQATATARRLLLIAAISLTLFEYLPWPYPTSQPIVPDWLRRQADTLNDDALLHLPNHLFVYNKHYMYYQTIHGKPIVNGKVARVPREALAFWERTPLLRTLAPEDSVAIDLPDISHQLSLLADANVRYLVIHKAFAAPGQLAAWQDWLTMPPYHEDDALLVYTTAPVAGQDFRIATPLTADFGFIATRPLPADPVAGGAITLDARWGAAARPIATAVCFSLSQNEAGLFTITQPLPAGMQANAIIRDTAVLNLPRSLPPGSYTLSATAVDATCDRPLGTAAVLTPITVRPYDPAAVTDIGWGDQIRLNGYTAVPADGQLNLALFWQAETALSTSYKYFVHLIDETSSQIVAQLDAVPRGWTYPTTVWQPETAVREDVSLSTSNLAPGRYTLSVGWYEEFSGAPLPADNGVNAVHLTTITLP